MMHAEAENLGIVPYAKDHLWAYANSKSTDQFSHPLCRIISIASYPQ